MKNQSLRTKAVLVIILVLASSFPSVCIPGCKSTSDLSADKNKERSGAFFSGQYRNLFTELLGKADREIKEKIDSAFNQIFYGDDTTQRLYYPAGEDMAYIEDVLHKDVRSEGMSYGMMICLQMDKQKEFNNLWKWAKTFMQIKSGPSKNYFAWQLAGSGKILDSTSAPDGEEWIVMALYFASGRWGDGEDIFNYRKEADIILDAMLHKDSHPENDGSISAMFNRNEKQVVFVPEDPVNRFTDPSYHLPHFYELWSLYSPRDNEFWLETAAVSREFWKKTVNPVTGLAPDYAEFDGTPKNPWGGGNDNFQYDAWRVAMNIAVDYEWFARDDWAVLQSNRLLKFFFNEGIKDYGHIYTLDGKVLTKTHGPGLTAMNAVAALAADTVIRKDFLRELWNTPVPSGMYRYYDGLLYMLAYLQVSGNFRIYNPEGIRLPDLKD